MKKAFKTAFLALIFSGLLSGIIIGSGIIYSWYFADAALFPEAAEIEPGDKVPLGGVLKADFTAVIPEGRKILSAEVVCGKGAVSPGEVQIRREKWRWNNGIWHFSFYLRPLAAAEIPEGSVNIVLSPRRGSDSAETVKVVVPGFFAEIPGTEKPGAVLELASPMEEPLTSGGKFMEHVSRHRYTYIGVAVFIVLLAAAAGYLILRRQEEKFLSSWDAALAALEVLRRDIGGQRVLPVAGFSRLNDILRNYLELRFGIPASRRTTPEFLAEMADLRSPLPERCRNLLTAFLNDSDLIRFGKVPAGAGKLENYLDRVETMVKETIPEDKNSKKRVDKRK